MVSGCTNCSKRQKGVIYRIIVYQMTSIYAERGLDVFVVKIYLKQTHAMFVAFILPPTVLKNPKKALKPGSVPSIFPFLQRKPKRELSYKRTQIKEKIAKDQVIDVNTTL